MNRKIKKHLLPLMILGFLLAGPKHILGQSFFNLRWHAGVNSSQVDGDSYSGYNKPGICGGIYVYHETNKEYIWSGGLCYIQKGARKNPNPKIGDYSTYLIRLNYIEMPLTLSKVYKDRYVPEIGIAAGYLFKSHEESVLGTYQSNDIKRTDYSFLLGCGLQLSTRFAFHFRYEYSIVPFRNFNFTNAFYPRFMGAFFNRGQYNNTISLTTYFNFGIAKI